MSYSKRRAKRAASARFARAPWCIKVSRKVAAYMLRARVSDFSLVTIAGPSFRVDGEIGDCVTISLQRHSAETEAVIRQLGADLKKQGVTLLAPRWRP